MCWWIKNINEKTTLLRAQQAEANPANHSGSMVRLLKIGLGFGIISWKAACKLLDKPKFIEALIATILCKPEIVKCSLFKIRLITSIS